MHSLLAPLLTQDNSWITFDLKTLGDQFWQNTVDGLTQGGIYALIALGYTLVYGVLKLINFAHSEVFVMGAFATWCTFYVLGFRADTLIVLTAGEIILFLGIALVVSALTSAGTAVLLERVAYRPLRRRNAPKLAFLITAIGASFGIQYTLRLDQLFGLNQRPAIRLLDQEPLFDVFGAVVTNIDLIIVVASVVLWFVADYFINRTRLGRGIRAVAQDPDTASLMGVNSERVIMLTFFVGGLLAGVAALFYMMRIPQGAIFNGGFLLGIKAFAAAVLGGIGNLRGALLGGLLLGIIENYGQSVFGGAWKDVVAFVVLVLVLMLRPTGLLGESLGKARA